MGNPDIHRPREQLSPAHRRADGVELLDGRRLADRDVVQHAEPAEDDGRQEQSAEVEPIAGQLLEVDDLLGSLGGREAGGLRRDDREDTGRREGDRGPEHRGEGRPREALGQE